MVDPGGVMQPRLQRGKRGAVVALPGSTMKAPA
jgi:hypothetical protein